jgi:hypothetical protein
MGTILDVINFRGPGLSREQAQALTRDPAAIFNFDFPPGQEPEQATVTDPFLIRVLQDGFQAEIDQEKAWLPARQLLGSKKSPLYRALYAEFRNNPQIRRRPARSPKTGRPMPNRTEINSADWYAHFAKEGVVLNVLADVPAPIADRFLEESRDLQDRLNNKKPATGTDRPSQK